MNELLFQVEHDVVSERFNIPSSRMLRFQVCRIDLIRSLIFQVDSYRLTRDSRVARVAAQKSEALHTLCSDDHPSEIEPTRLGSTTIIHARKGVRAEEDEHGKESMH